MIGSPCKPMMGISLKNSFHKVHNTEPFCLLSFCKCKTPLFHIVLLNYSSVHSFGATLTVDTGSCIETNPEVYLNPGDTVILNCNVTNPLTGFNFLVWNVPIGGPGQLVLSNTNENSINSLFSATVDDDARTVSGQLMFTASDTLDEMIVTCSNNDPAIEDTCTLQVTSE